MSDCICLHESIIEFHISPIRNRTSYLTRNIKNATIGETEPLSSKKGTREKASFTIYLQWLALHNICIKPSNLSERLSIFRSKQLNHATYVCSFWWIIQREFMHSVFCIHRLKVWNYVVFFYWWNRFRSIFFNFFFSSILNYT